MADTSQLSFPRHSAKTLRFTLGAPRTFTLSPDGQRLIFVRSASGTDRIGRLYQYDLRSDVEELLVDPLNLLVDGAEQLSPEERARRERTREAAGGITSYSSDKKCEFITFVLSGKLYTLEISSKRIREEASAGIVIDPQLAPDGKSIAYITPEGELHLSREGKVKVLCTPENPDIFYGTAEFVASEEMSRHHGFWWSADSQSLFVQRFDQTPVTKIFISDSANPESAPREVRYPFVGTANVITSLLLLNLEDLSRKEISWNPAHEYLCDVNPGPIGPLPWSEDAVKYAATQMPASKVFLGIPGYGRDWITKVEGVCPKDFASSVVVGAKAAVVMREALALATTNNAAPTYNQTHAESTFTYKKTYVDPTNSASFCTASRTVWFPDERSYAARTNLVGKYRLGGIAVWTFGMENTAAITAVRDIAKSIAPFGKKRMLCDTQPI